MVEIGDISAIVFLNETIKNEVEKLQQSKHTDCEYNISYFGELSESKKIELNSIKEEFLLLKELSEGKYKHAFIKDNKYVIEVDYNKELGFKLVKLAVYALFAKHNFEYLMIDPNNECLYLKDFSSLREKIKEVVYSNYVFLSVDEQKNVYCISDIFKINNDVTKLNNLVPAVFSNNIKDLISKGYVILIKRKDCDKSKNTWLEDIINNNKESFIIFKE